jgi:SET domain
MCLQMDLLNHKDSCKLVSDCFSNCEKAKLRDNFRPPQEISQIETTLAFAYRLIAQLGPEEILQRVSEPAPDWKQPAKYLSKSCMSPLVALLNLTDHIGRVNCKEMNVYSTVALKTASSYGLSLEKRDILAAAILKIILVAKFNNKCITHLTIDVMTGVSMHSRYVGWGLYLASSFLNHSCTANTTPVFYGTNAVFYAIKPIKAGEQLTHEYIISVNAPASKRQDLFNSMHNFTCTCVACKEG